MLFVNDVELKEGMPQWEKYQKFLKEVIPELPETVLFKTTDPIEFNSTGLVEASRLKFIPFEAKDYDEELGSQHWRYCETAPAKNQNGKFIYKPLGMQFKRSKAVIKKQQPDFIFFMMELSANVKDGSIICEDKKKEARRVIEKDDKSVAVKFMIYNSLSPLSPKNTGNEDMLRMIAAAWGVSQSHNKRKSLDQIRVELFGIVEGNEKKHDTSGRGFDTFLSEIKSSERLVLRANIQRAVDNQVIAYDKDSFTWKYNPNGQKILTLQARFFGNPANGLFEHYLNDDNKRKVFYATLEDKYHVRDPLDDIDDLSREVTPSDAEETEEESTPHDTGSVDDIKARLEGLGEMKWFTMQKWGRDLGLKVTGVNKQDLTDSIRGYYALKKELHNQ